MHCDHISLFNARMKASRRKSEAFRYDEYMQKFIIFIIRMFRRMRPIIRCLLKRKNIRVQVCILYRVQQRH